MQQSTLKTKPQLSNRPLYLQIRDYFLGLIASGEWAADRLIESEADLATTLNVSVGTVRKALDTLEAEGLVSRRQGRGTTVNNQSSEELMVRYSNLRIGDGDRISGQVESFDCVLAVTNEIEMRHLQISARDMVFRSNRVRHYKGRRFMCETIAIPQRIMPNLTIEDFSNPRVAAFGARRHGMLIGKANEKVDISQASSEIAEILGIPIDTPLLRLDRIVLSIDGRPLEWRIAQCHLQGKYYMAEML